MIHIETDYILMTKDVVTVVNNVSSSQENRTVYNLNIEDNHNYAIGHEAILVHNKGSSPPNELTFTIDHPYLFFIIDNESDSILFMGTIFITLIQIYINMDNLVLISYTNQEVEVISLVVIP